MQSSSMSKIWGKPLAAWQPTKMAMILDPIGHQRWFTPRIWQISSVVSNGLEEFPFATTKIWHAGKTLNAASRVSPINAPDR